ncbi:MAG: cupredoxin domain-containing protein [Patescibacteria group bacterium]|jgi:plastocyanin
MRTTARFAAVLVVGSVLLVGCTAANTNSATNTIVVLDLVNEPVVNVNSQVNVNAALGNANSSAQNSNVHATNVNSALQSTKKVTITATGFSPASLTIAKGTAITWTNRSGSPAKVASNPHPTSTDLPGLVSAILADGETYSYTFTQVGTWGYHDHEHPTVKGSIIVE